MLWWQLRKIIKGFHDPATWQQGISELLRIGPPARKALVDALQNKDPNIRAASALALGFMRDASAWSAVLGAVGDPAPNVRHAAVKAIAQFGNVEAFEALLGLFNDTELADTAADATAMFSGDYVVARLVQVLESEPPYCALSAAAKTLAAIGGPVPGAVLAARFADLCSILRGLVPALRKMGPDFVLPLLEVMPDLDADDCAAATECLTQMARPDGGASPASPAWAAAAIPTLVHGLDDLSANVREKSAAALDACRWQPHADADRAKHALAAGKYEQAAACGAAAVPGLAAALLDGSDVQHRRLSHEAFAHQEHCKRVANALASVGAPAVHALIGALECDDEALRDAAAIGLAEIGEAATKPLIAALDEARAPAHVTAIMAGLRRLGWKKKLGPAALAPLLARLDDDDESVRSAAARGLAAMGDGAVEPLLEALSMGGPPGRLADVLAALRDCEGLAAAGSRAMRPLLAALDRPEEDICKAAGEALARMGEQAIEPLVAKLREGGAPARVAAIARALSWLRNAAPRLIAVADDCAPEARRAIIQLLAERTDPIADIRSAKLRAQVECRVLVRAVDLQNGGTSTIDKVGYSYVPNRGAESSLWQAIDNLGHFVERHARELDIDDLRSVTGMESTYVSVQRSCAYEDGFSREGVDSSRPRQAARQELIRRGVQA
jgi:HEAT repeat protein